MKVELADHVGKNVATGREVKFSQYRILVDGKLVGYKSWKSGTKIVFIGRLSPFDKEVVENEVSAMIAEDSEGVMPPDVSKEDVAEAEENHNDFD